MDQWDRMLEESVAARMAALQAETEAQASRKADSPSEEEKNSAVHAEAAASTTGRVPIPPEPNAIEAAIAEALEDPTHRLYQSKSDDFAPLQPGEYRTITIDLPVRQQTPNTKTEQSGQAARGDGKPARRAAENARRRKKPEARKRQAAEGRTQKAPEERRPLPKKPIRKSENQKEAAPGGRSKRKGRMTSLQTRWLLNSMGPVSLVLIFVAAVAILAMSNYYYSTMAAGLENKVQTAADFFATYQTESEYEERASSYVSNFAEADSIELEFIDTAGEIIYSSYAYQQTSGAAPGTKDIVQALSTGTLYCWTGTDPVTGERIMAVSAPVIQNGAVRGVIRMVTSTRLVDRQMLLLTLILVVLVAVILVLIYSTNLYFVKSIAEPIADITETTKRIAAGSYGVQIETQYYDEIGELVNTINDMSLKVSQAEKVKSEFISSVSHELRTPLTAINGWGETLMRGEVTDQRDIQKGLSIIVSEAKRLTKMVEELLEFSRIEDGRFTLRIEPIDIKAELEDAVYTYREFFRKKGIALEYQDCEEEFPPIPGDPERLRQVFSNLLDNAAKHGGSGKRITVSIRPDGEYVAICIRDYGHGIPPEELPHVKTKFYKGSSKARGSGIGLAVCDEIAQRHNGTLDIANAEGGGCAATLRLPLHEE